MDGLKAFLTACLPGRFITDRQTDRHDLRQIWMDGRTDSLTGWLTEANGSDKEGSGRVRSVEGGDQRRRRKDEMESSCMEKTGRAGSNESHGSGRPEELARS